MAKKSNKNEVIVKIEGKEWKDALDKAFQERVKKVSGDGVRKGKDPTLYWIWFAIGGTVMFASIALLIIAIIKRKKNNESII